MGQELVRGLVGCIHACFLDFVYWKCSPLELEFWLFTIGGMILIGMNIKNKLIPLSISSIHIQKASRYTTYVMTMIEHSGCRRECVDISFRAGQRSYTSIRYMRHRRETMQSLYCWLTAGLGPFMSSTKFGVHCPTQRSPASLRSM